MTNNNIADDLTLDLGNGITLELVRVSGGSFIMGSPDDDYERPQHRVTLQEFLIGKYSVTNAQWQAVMGTIASPKHDPKFQGANHPVIGVSWDDAKKFCKELSQIIKKNVRLASEAEWEYTAKGGNQSKGFIYAGSNNLNNVGWYGSNSGSETHPIGQKIANELGIYDMSGNVFEWCEDVWHENYNDAPNDGSAWLTGGDQSKHALRGSSWGSDESQCRLTYRYGFFTRNTHYCIGFRVVVA